MPFRFFVISYVIFSYVINIKHVQCRTCSLFDRTSNEQIEQLEYFERSNERTDVCSELYALCSTFVITSLRIIKRHLKSKTIRILLLHLFCLKISTNQKLFINKVVFFEQNNLAEKFILNLKLTIVKSHRQFRTFDSSTCSNSLGLIVKSNNNIDVTIFKNVFNISTHQLIEPNIRICAQLINTQINVPANSFCTGYTPQALKRKKGKAKESSGKTFVDLKYIRAVGGKGGDGCISFLQLWANDKAGCDGSDAGDGGHVVFEATYAVNNLSHVPSLAKANDGDNGRNKDRHGKSADHKIIPVPVGTIVRATNGKVIGDLDKEGSMFVAARGGAGGKGNHFFASNNEKAPQVCEYGARGEDLAYTLESRSHNSKA